MKNTCRFYIGQGIMQMGSMIDASVNQKLTREELLKWYIKQYSLYQKFAFSYKPVLNRNKNCLEAASWWNLSFTTWWRIVALGFNLPKQGITFLTIYLKKKLVGYYITTATEYISSVLEVIFPLPFNLMNKLISVIYLNIISRTVSLVCFRWEGVFIGQDTKAL